MQTNPKKFKAILIFCVLAIIFLIALSTFLTIKVHAAKKELANQQQKLTELEQTINDYENLPNNNNSEIITQGES